MNILQNVFANMQTVCQVYFETELYAVICHNRAELSMCFSTWIPFPQTIEAFEPSNLWAQFLSRAPVSMLVFLYQL